MLKKWRGVIVGAAILGCATFPQAGTARAEGMIVEHTVRAGDNLHLIAGYYYKDPRQWKKIYRLNKKLIRNASVLEPGKVLRIDVEPGQAWEVPYEEFVARVHGK
jgi:nucleoid-associated protein YgaU